MLQRYVVYASSTASLQCVLSVSGQLCDFENVCGVLLVTADAAAAVATAILVCCCFYNACFCLLLLLVR